MVAGFLCAWPGCYATCVVEVQRPDGSYTPGGAMCLHHAELTLDNIRSVLGELGWDLVPLSLARTGGYLR